MVCVLDLFLLTPGRVAHILLFLRWQCHGNVQDLLCIQGIWVELVWTNYNCISVILCVFVLFFCFCWFVSFLLIILIANTFVHTEPRLCSEGEMDITVSSTMQRCVLICGEVQKMSTETRKTPYAGITVPLKQRNRLTTGLSSSRPSIVLKSGKLLPWGTTHRMASRLLTRTRHALRDSCPGRDCLLQKLYSTA